jgi:aminomethyltransferase
MSHDRSAIIESAALPTFEQQYYAIRGGIGITDVGSMTKLRIHGDGATALLDSVLSGNVRRLVENSIRWTAMLDEQGHIIADVQLYNDFGTYLVTCSRNMREQALRALRSSGYAVEIEDLTDALAAVAIEGPAARDLPANVIGPEVAGLSLLKFTRCRAAGGEVLLARIGFTGEFGYVMFGERDVVHELATRVSEQAGAVHCDTAVHDVLRLEMRAFSIARDLLRDESALEAGLHWMIDFRKPAFRGREAVMAEKDSGLRQRMVAFVADEVGALDRGSALTDDGRPVGYVANVAWSPHLSRTIGVAYVEEKLTWVGVDLGIDASAGGGRIRIVSAPFFVTESTRRGAE